MSIVIGMSVIMFTSAPLASESYRVVWTDPAGHLDTWWFALQERNPKLREPNLPD